MAAASLAFTLAAPSAPGAEAASPDCSGSDPAAAVRTPTTQSQPAAPPETPFNQPDCQHIGNLPLLDPAWRPLTGEWGGARTRLQEAGLDFKLYSNTTGATTPTAARPPASASAAPTT
jgi:hypothetical protein